MSLPRPPVALKGDCSAIHDNILYSYSAAAFQALKLEEGAEWATLPGGESVNGAVCVGSTPADDSLAGFYVVGGTAADPNYSGLQKFTYATQKWETLTPNANVPVVNPNHITQNRKWHSATYLPAGDQLLIYAGTDNGEQAAASSTFAIQASAPYSVASYEPIVAPAAVAPLLLPWSDSQAVMVGGGAANTKIVLWDKTEWKDTGASLAAPLQDTTVLKGTIMRGEDSSVSLYTFDATTSPVTVRRFLLMDEKGAPILNAVPVEATQGDAAHAKRALTANSWPAYNASLAPTSPRTDYSLAATKDGLMVLSGGNDREVLDMFDGKKNAWLNATQVLLGSQFVANTVSVTSSTASITATSSPTSSSPTVSATATSTESSSPIVAPIGDAGGIATTTILAIVLGSVFGLALLLFLVLLFMRRAKAKKSHAEAGQARGAGGYPEEKDYSQYKAGNAGGPFVRGHQQQSSANSFSSMAILMGKVQKPGLQRKPSNDSKRSSVSSIFNRQFKATIGKPQLQPTPQIGYDSPEDKETLGGTSVQPARPTPRTQQRDLTQDGNLRRSSGWNRYWSGGSTLNVLGFGGNSKRQTVTSDGSQYSDMNRMTQDSATVPPLKVEGGPSFNSVNTGSPTVSGYNSHIPEHMSGKIEERPVSAVSSSGYSSGIPASVRDSWEAVNAKSWDNSARAPSSMYSQFTTPGHQQEQAPPMPQPLSNGTRAPTGLSQQPQLAVAATSSDMSWLNLGAQGRKL